MTSHVFELPDVVQRRALLRGRAGARWMEGLGDLVGELERDWQFRVDRQLSGGTEALVLAVVRNGGEPAVLKIVLPGELTTEALALRLAAGVGYATLLEHDESRGAMLLERLGEKLVDCGYPVRRQIEIICQTLQASWRKVDTPNGLTTGREKARWLAEFISDRWRSLDEPCASAVKDQALAFAEERASAYVPERSVLVHGDAHPWNTLRQLDPPPPGTPASFKFVDPDGLMAEPAYDLAISLREWSEELLAGDALQLGKERCRLLSELTGVDENGIWQWGFIERTSTGLLCVQLEWEAPAREHFAVAERWLDA